MKKQETKSVRIKGLKNRKEDSENDHMQGNKSSVFDQNYLMAIKNKRFKDKKHQSFETLRLQFNRADKHHQSGTLGIVRSLNISKVDSGLIEPKTSIQLSNVKPKKRKKYVPPSLMQKPLGKTFEHPF